MLNWVCHGPVLTSDLWEGLGCGEHVLNCQTLKTTSLSILVTEHSMSPKDGSELCLPPHGCLDMMGKSKASLLCNPGAVGCLYHLCAEPTEVRGGHCTPWTVTSHHMGVGAGTWTHSILSDTPTLPSPPSSFPSLLAATILPSWSLLASLLPAVVLSQHVPLLQVWREMSKVQDHRGVTLYQNCSVTLSVHQPLKKKTFFTITCAWNDLLFASPTELYFSFKDQRRNYILPEASCGLPWLLLLPSIDGLWATPESRLSPFPSGLLS